MKKFAFAAALLLLAATAFAQAPNPYFKGTFDEAQAKAKAENKKLLLYFDSYT
jgi:hypothetical protein